jgi:hypothetical protein
MYDRCIAPVTHTAVLQGRQGCHVALHVANLLLNLLHIWKTFHHVPDTPGMEKDACQRDSIEDTANTLVKRSIDIRATIFVIQDKPRENLSTNRRERLHTLVTCNKIRSTTT